jgi:WhiB family redox-sensing transcriptional regulator
MTARHVYKLRTESPEWKLGACYGTGSDAFFPEGYSLAMRDALSTCARCQIREACLEYGLNEEHGIWGGMTERQRRAERTRRRNRAVTLLNLTEER